MAPRIRLSPADAAMKRHMDRQAKLAAGKKLRVVTGPRVKAAKYNPYEPNPTGYIKRF